MNLQKFTGMLVVGSLLSFAATGCKHGPQNVTPLPGNTVSGPGDIGSGNALGPGDGTGGEPTPVAQPDAGKFDSYNQNTEIFKAYTIHFAYDSSAIRSSEESNLAAVADYMKAHPTEALRIEGNCDERGTDQYNYALGERRALAARQALTDKGVDGSRVVTVSYGRSRPVDNSHTEEARARNRRDDFVLLTPP